MNCLACKSLLTVFGKKGGYTILRCPKCGLGQTIGTDKQGESYHRDKVYIQEREKFKNIFLRRLDLITSSRKRKGRVLEVGSSTGLMLSLFKSCGWEVLGIEPSKQAASFAKKEGIATVNENFEETKIPKDKFDAVIINHTLEHMDHPDEILAKVAHTLTKDGLLLIDVPNFGSWSAKLKGINWPYLLPVEHRWHFTGEALRQLLEKNGFEVLTVQSTSGIWDYRFPATEVIHSLIHLKKSFITESLTMIPSLMATLCNKGTSLTVLSKKVR
jgi:SAM-dependent methyltransferase